MWKITFLRYCGLQHKSARELLKVVYLSRSWLALKPFNIIMFSWRQILTLCLLALRQEQMKNFKVDSECFLPFMVLFHWCMLSVESHISPVVLLSSYICGLNSKAWLGLYLMHLDVKSASSGVVFCCSESATNLLDIDFSVAGWQSWRPWGWEAVSD